MTADPKQESVEEVLKALDRFDWGQPVGQDWNPCFFMEDDGRFCGRAERWWGHEVGKDHSHHTLREVFAAALERRNAAILETAFQMAELGRRSKWETDSTLGSMIELWAARLRAIANGD